MIEIVKEIVVFSPFILSLFAFFSLFIRNWNKDEAKLVMSYYMLCGSIFYAFNILKNFEYMEVYNYFHLFYIALLMIACPLIYIYVRSLTFYKGFGKSMIFHFLPGFIALYVGNVLYFQLNFDERIEFLENMELLNFQNTPFKTFIYLFLNSFVYIFVVQIIFYYVKTRRILIKHQAVLNDIFSESMGIDLSWVKYFLRVIMLWGIFGIIGYAFLMNSFPDIAWISFVSDFSISFLIVGMYILGSMQNSIPYDYVLKTRILEIPNDSINNHKLKEKLLICFEEKKIYLKKDLTIWDVCRETNSNRTYISNLINEEFEMNFNCFVNKYRVEEAHKLLKNSKFTKKTVEEIASLSGFNSLASFNRAFKKLEGCSPRTLRTL